MENTAKEQVLHIRVDEEEMKIVKELTKEVYGFRSAGEFIRYAIAHINENRPVLGKDFTPESVKC